MEQNTELKQRPCLEEFVAAGYKAEIYDEFFEKRGGYGPGWSDPNWTAPTEEELMHAPPEVLRDLPATLLVHDRTNHPSTRTARAVSRKGLGDKQYLFGNPSKRLMPGRTLSITREELFTNLDWLIQYETYGTLSVHVAYGARLDLQALKRGTLATQLPPPPSPLPHPPLDSIANDKPWGEQMPQYLGGTFHGDPAAERAVEEMTRQKTEELSRKGALDEPPVDPAAERAALDEVKTEEAQAPLPPIPDVVPPAPGAELNDELERAKADPNYIPVFPTPEAAASAAAELDIQEQDKSSMDPAAERSESSKKQGGGKKGGSKR